MVRMLLVDYMHIRRSNTYRYLTRDIESSGSLRISVSTTMRGFSVNVCSLERSGEKEKSWRG